jgi:hypothetical protein
MACLLGFPVPRAEAGQPVSQGFLHACRHLHWQCEFSFPPPPGQFLSSPPPFRIFPSFPVSCNYPMFCEMIYHSTFFSPFLAASSAIGHVRLFRRRKHFGHWLDETSAFHGMYAAMPPPPVRLLPELSFRNCSFGRSLVSLSGRPGEVFFFIRYCSFAFLSFPSYSLTICPLDVSPHIIGDAG